MSGLSSLTSRNLRPAAVALVALAALASWPVAAHAAGLLIADGGFGGRLEIKEQQVHVTINNGVAVTDVEQIFVNTENRVVEALYTFPVPSGASVSNFSMWIDGREMIGEVVEKERARQIYESYKTVRRDPGLLEQVDYKRFDMRIFPIAAGAEQRVRVTYYQELDFDHDWATYVYPLATVTTASADSRTEGRFAISLDVRSEVPISALKSPSHDEDFVVVQQGTQNYWQASLEVREGDLNRDAVIAYHLEKPHTGVDVIASKQANEDGYFMLTLTAGKELEEQTQGADYVFVLDVSGSMAFDGKLGLSRRSVGQFVDSLGEQDRFEIIAFNAAPESLFGKLTDVTAADKRTASNFMESRTARGGTVLRPAIEIAYRYRQDDRPLNVVVLSDGMTEEREQKELLAAVAKKPAGTTVFCVGVGNEVNRPLLAQLAHEAGGLAAFVSQGDDFERQAQAFRRKLTRPAMTNVQIGFDGGGVYSVEPKQLPNLYHGQPLRLYGRYRGAGDATVSLKANVLGNAVEQVTKVQLPPRDDGNPEIERMWAYNRVMRLTEDGRREGKLATLRPEIVGLCEGYSIASEFASFIVLENDAEFRRWKIERRNVARVGRDRKAQDAVRDQLAQLREKAQQQLGPQPAGAAKDQVASSSTYTARDLGPLEPGSVDRGPGRSGGGGGGAVDPLTALAACGLAGAGLVARWRPGRGPRPQAPAQKRERVD